MKKLIIYFVIPFFALTLSNCKKDCNGSFTIEGTLWNGTKNQPHTNTKIEIAAGGKSSIYTGVSNGKDLGTVYTNNLGKFTFTYNCIDEDDWDIVLKPKILQATHFFKVPLNQNYSQFYNIPDSVTIKVYIKPRQPLGLNDTAYLRIPGANEYFDNKSYYAPFYRIYSNSMITDGYFKTIRIRYKDQNYPLDNALKFRTARGYNNYLNTLSNTPEFSVLLNKMEPDVNEITLYY
ncbi:MAG: hypothetical protein KBE91_09070 [Bacteroidia bacterium]|nr:hypothetical protein [Bacteroidia bacterium]